MKTESRQARSLQKAWGCWRAKVQGGRAEGLVEEEVVAQSPVALGLGSVVRENEGNWRSGRGLWRHGEEPWKQIAEPWRQEEEPLRLGAEPYSPERPLAFCGHWLPAGQAKVINNTITAFVSLEGRGAAGPPRLEGGPLEDAVFIFEQMHFHWAADNHSGSEHSIDGRKYAGEAHLVHYNSKYSGFEEACKQPDGLVVTGLLLSAHNFLPGCSVRPQTPRNPRFQALTEAVQRVCLPDDEARIPAEDCLPWMLDISLSDGYFTYRGSLTTPPYLESVTWIVYDKPINVSTDQMEAFRSMKNSREPGFSNIISCNARALQPRPVGLRVRHVENTVRVPHTQSVRNTGYVQHTIARFSNLGLKINEEENRSVEQG